MNRLQDEMSRLFDRWGGAGPRVVPRNVYPLLNMWEDEGRLYVEAELPGLELDDLEMYVTGENTLSIKGERKQPEVASGTWHRQERGYGAFSRVIELPSPVNNDAVTAQFQHGVLTVTLPKREAAKSRRITVKTG
jgi:HSP20 family protein